MSERPPLSVTFTVIWRAAKSAPVAKLLVHVGAPLVQSAPPDVPP
ncbi:MAG: hypothetical protein U0P81_02415 [Holophagaceae bacterium]